MRCFQFKRNLCGALLAHLNLICALSARKYRTLSHDETSWRGRVDRATCQNLLSTTSNRCKGRRLIRIVFRSASCVLPSSSSSCPTLSLLHAASKRWSVHGFAQRDFHRSFGPNGVRCPHTRSCNYILLAANPQQTAASATRPNQ